MIKCIVGDKMKVEISKTCCLCYGAKRALDIALDNAKQGKNVVLLKELLHNKRAVSLLQNLGVKQVDCVEDLKDGDIAIIRAHGEPKETYQYFSSHNIEYIDCTCPNVKAINLLVERKDNEGYKIIIVGKYGHKTGKMHPEVFGTSHHCNNPILVEDEEEIASIDTTFPKYFLVVQTTFSSKKAKDFIEKIKNKIENAGKFFEYRDTTCNAQHLINKDSLDLAQKVDKMIVVGGKNSSNSIELYKNLSQVVECYFVEGIDEVKSLSQQNVFLKDDFVGLTGGASTVMEELLEIKEYLLHLHK
jgi:4-hydroxy-3-methylbut-2-en-1-yl diphosphate reductase